MAAPAKRRRATQKKVNLFNFEPKSRWKQVDIDPSVFADENFSGFASLEELTDYDLTNYNTNHFEEYKTSGSATKKTGAIKLSKSKTEWKSKQKTKGKDVILEPLKKSDQTGKDVKASKKDLESSYGRKRKSGRQLMIDLKRRRRGLRDNVSTENDSSSKLISSKGSVQDKTDDVDMSGWSDLSVPDPVLAALRDLRFTKPTPIQSRCLEPAIKQRKDIVGAAETGSGKTLAFGIPLIHHILHFKSLQKTNMQQQGISSKNKSTDSMETDFQNNQVADDSKHGTPDSQDNTPDSFENSETASLNETVRKDLLGLILTPTRELAVQIKNHLVAIMKYTDIKVAVVVGGMSAQKQERVLKKKPEIVVGTPGRIWELYNLGQPHLGSMVDVRYLIIDEADRMVERGRYAELADILDLLNRWMCSSLEQDTLSEFASANQTEMGSLALIYCYTLALNQVLSENPTLISEYRSERQTMVFSATLSLVHLGPNRRMVNWKTMSKEEKLESVIEKIGLREDAEIVDLTKREGTADTLLESKIFCRLNQKDIYLFYFLSQYPGRTLVFCNSIDCIRRLISIFTLLECCPLPLHSSMHQKQRLKNLERFANNPKGLLLATDVAARGLDIPDVQHVIHYQVPRTSEIYIHRSGRTARQTKQGLSVMLLSEKELGLYKRLCKTLDKEEIAGFPVAHCYYEAVRQRVDIAREVDSMSHQYEKKKHKNSWFQQAAEEMDIELDEELALEDLGSKREQKMHEAQINSLKAQLKTLLKKRIFPTGSSQLYITSMGSVLAPMKPDELGTKSKALTKLQRDKDFAASQAKEKRFKEQRKKRLAQMQGQSNQQLPKQKKSKNKFKNPDLNKG